MPHVPTHMVVEIVIKTIKVKTGQQVNGCNNDGNMDRGTMVSLVMSLSQKTKENKTQAMVNKLQLGN